MTQTYRYLTFWEACPVLLQRLGEVLHRRANTCYGIYLPLQVRSWRTVITVSTTWARNSEFLTTTIFLAHPNSSGKEMPTL